MPQIHARSPRSPSGHIWPGLACLLVWAGVGLGCSSTTSTPGVVDGGAGIVAGDAGFHCSGMTPVLVNQASCHVVDAGPIDPDAGVEPMAEIHFGNESDDDDCKYHVVYTSTPVLVNQNVTFHVTATKIAENDAPATNADVVIESYVADNDLHVIPNNGTKTTETPAGSGVYAVTPVKFDQSGRWVVRFHFYENCDDIFDDSPHGHVAFYYDVP